MKQPTANFLLDSQSQKDGTKNACVIGLVARVVTCPLYHILQDLLHLEKLKYFMHLEMKIHVDLFFPEMIKIPL